MSHLSFSLSRIYKQSTGSSAVEFALITPCFLLLIFGLSIYASIYVTLNGIQQLAAEAARASVAGLNDTERNQLAQAYISNNMGAYPFLNTQKLTITAGTTGTAAPTYQVSLAYDMSGSFIYSFTRLLPLPPPQIVRSAAIQRGGY
jgi:Flp pilus assembly protein TadG